MSTEEIPHKLYEYFKKQDISQSEIAERFKVSKASINALFTGKRAFGKKQAEKFEKEFGISKSWLLTGQGEMLCPNISQENVSGPNVVGESTVNNNITEDFIKLLQKKDEQIDRLLTLLENQQKQK